MKKAALRTVLTEKLRGDKTRDVLTYWEKPRLAPFLAAL
jgi:hypothetical protein